MARVNTEKMVKVEVKGREFAFGKARKNEYGEWVIKVYINGEYSEDCTIYADSKEDAEATMNADIARMSKTEENAVAEEVTAPAPKAENANEVEFYNGWTNENVKIDASNLTELETKIMINARTNDYSDVFESGGEWACSLDSGNFSLDSKKVRGAVSSLIKKGYMRITVEDDPRDNTFYLTEAGKKLYSDYEG